MIEEQKRDFRAEAPYSDPRHPDLIGRSSATDVSIKKGSGTYSRLKGVYSRLKSFYQYRQKYPNNLWGTVARIQDKYPAYDMTQTVRGNWETYSKPRTGLATFAAQTMGLGVMIAGCANAIIDETKRSILLAFTCLVGGGYIALTAKRAHDFNNRQYDGGNINPKAPRSWLIARRTRKAVDAYMSSFNGSAQQTVTPQQASGRPSSISTRKPSDFDPPIR